MAKSPARSKKKSVNKLSGKSATKRTVRSIEKHDQRKRAPVALSESGKTPETGFKIRDKEIERVLITGSHEGLLEEYFGSNNYRELRELAQQASGTSVRGGPRVLILPGIMGSKIGKERSLLFDDVIWLDPIDIARGKLMKLAFRRQQKYKALGVMLFAYLKLKLHLKIAGFNADFYPFDWRQSIKHLGAKLAQKIEKESSGKLHIVAHSMGGLVARAALTHSAQKKVGRFVMLGTPNFGSFVPVQAIRGTYPVVRKLAALDLANSVEELSERVFKTFPGLLEMLPSPKRYSRVNLYDSTVWPGDAPAPTQDSLDSVLPVQESLAAADKRFYLIAGVNQDTTIGMGHENGTFQYEVSKDGDGTVPLSFAELPGATTYYIEESHGSLPNNSLAGSAVIDVLRSGETRRLPRTWERRGQRAIKVVPEQSLRKDPFDGRKVSELSQRDRRQLLAEFISPDSHESAPAYPSIEGGIKGGMGGAGHGMSHSIKNVAVTRRRTHAIEICLAQGDIAEVHSRATVLGLFREVEPAGAAASIDTRLDGAVKEFTTRRMFSGEVGEVFAMPTGRHMIYAETVLFTGLGNFDLFSPDVQQFVAENVVRTFVHTHVEDFASVLLGGSSGWSIQSIVYNQLRGYFSGILDADNEHTMRRITLCEYDPDRFMEMKEEVYRLASTELFDDMVVTFDEIKLPEPAYAGPAGRRRRVKSDADFAYLIVNQEEHDNDRLTFRSSILTAGAKAAVLTGTKDISRTEIARQLSRIEAQSFTFERLINYGEGLAKLVLHDTVAEGLREMQDKGYHVVVVHDAPASRIPWETICVDGRFPAGGKGLSRRYAAGNLSVAKWLEERRIGETLDVLLVVNPTLDLVGAEQEGNRIEELFKGASTVRLKKIHGENATRSALISEFQSGKYDVIHYAGHAFFDQEDRSRSGIICNGRQILSGAHLAGIGKLPALLFFNACESGRVRRGEQRKDKSLDMNERINRNVGLAEAFMRGGAANYVGTYWPVGDEAAKVFAGTFYRDLVQGAPIGRAIQNGRDEIRKQESVDWADYIHYGSYDFRLKIRDDE